MHLIRGWFSCSAAEPGFLLGAAILGSIDSWGAAPRPIPPETERQEVIDYYHGRPIVDPYRWLEDDQSAATQAWVERQNEVTFGYLKSLPQRQPLRDRLTALWNYERYGLPVRRGNRYFLSRNDGLQNQSVLYRLDSLAGEPVALLDPNTLSADGTIALSGVAISQDGRRLAYGLSAGGSDWQEWRVREVDSGRDLPDVVRWVKFSQASWRKDGSGFYYSRYQEPKAGEQLRGANRGHQLWFHRVGTGQEADTLVYERPDHPDWLIRGQVTDDDRYLLIEINHGTRTQNRIFYRDLAQSDGKVVELLGAGDAAYRFVDNDATRFFFRTDLDAPRGRVIAIDVDRPARGAWREVLPQAADTLRSASVVGRHWIVEYLHHARSLVKVFDTNGTFVRTLELPGIGTATGFEGRKDDSETFYSFAGFTAPGTLYRYDVASGRSELFREPKTLFDAAQFQTVQVFYRSKDGTRIPMFLSHRKGLALDGQQPTLLYGYGGFGLSLAPSFSVPMLAWMELGGVYAVANLRGGGEYGLEWHRAGIKDKRQNVFDDFIAAAEWLFDRGYTRPSKLAIHGRSNGGLLVGACMTQRPDLFAVALPGVGVLDMLRFHKFTIGWAWTSDYGSAEVPAEFPALRAYSPYHNLRAGQSYPATLITTADHDDRVVPAHSFKFAAALQGAHRGEAPVLIRVDVRAGHGAGKPTSKQIEEWSDILAFTAQNLGLETR